MTVPETNVDINSPGSFLLKEGAPPVGDLEDLNFILANAHRLHLETKFEEAIKFWKAALVQCLNYERTTGKHYKDTAGILAGLGEAYLCQRHTVHASACLREAIERNPTLSKAKVRLADCYHITGDTKHAFTILRKCENEFRGPEKSLWYGAYADALKRELRFDAAEQMCRKAIKCNPDNGLAEITYGSIMHDMERFDEALYWTKRAYEHQPHFWNASSYGLHLMLLGFWEEGIKFNEKRLAQHFLSSAVVPWWDGTYLDGTLQITSEGGLGDVLHLSRYAPLVKSRVKDCYFTANKKFAEISRHMDLGMPVYDWDKCPKPDRQEPLMSLLLHCEMWKNPIPPPIKLNIEPWNFGKKAAHISWYGMQSHVNDVGRSMRLKDFADIVRAFPDYHWFTVSPDKRVTEEIAETGLPITQYAGTYVEAAGKIAGADFAVTVDTGLAHLSGSLLVPTYMVLRFYTDWRWMMKGNRSIWYPDNMEVYRCGWRSSWEETSKRMIEDIRNGKALDRYPEQTTEEVLRGTGT